MGEGRVRKQDIQVEAKFKREARYPSGSQVQAESQVQVEAKLKRKSDVQAKVRYSYGKPVQVEAGCGSA